MSDTETFTFSASRIKTAWLRRLAIVVMFPFLVVLSMVLNSCALGFIVLAFAVRVAWAVVTLEAMGVPKLVRTARKVW